MRHGKKFNHLGRKVGHRRALLKNLAIALIEHKRINTTLAKAKALRVYVEPIITKGKTNTTHNRRLAFSHLQDKEIVTELFSTVADKVADRPGGYTRIIKTGFRKGDGAEMAMIELVDFNDIYTSGSEVAEKKTRRGRRKSKGAGAVEAAAGVAVAKEVLDEITPEVIEGDLGSDPELDILLEGNVEESGTIVISEDESKLGASEDE